MTIQPKLRSTTDWSIVATLVNEAGVAVDLTGKDVFLELRQFRSQTTPVASFSTLDDTIAVAENVVTLTSAVADRDFLPVITTQIRGELLVTETGGAIVHLADVFVWIEPGFTHTTSTPTTESVSINFTVPGNFFLL